jgi:hypothetical protein
MTPAQLTRWGERYNLTLKQVQSLKLLINRYAYQGVRYCNGDPHPLVHDKQDKSACSEAWGADRDKTGDKLEKLIKELGFDDIDFGVGLYPALAKDGDTCIMVP